MDSKSVAIGSLILVTLMLSLAIVARLSAFIFGGQPMREIMREI